VIKSNAEEEIEKEFSLRPVLKPQ